MATVEVDVEHYREFLEKTYIEVDKIYQELYKEFLSHYIGKTVGYFWWKTPIITEDDARIHFSEDFHTFRLIYKPNYTKIKNLLKLCDAADTKYITVSENEICFKYNEVEYKYVSY